MGTGRGVIGWGWLDAMSLHPWKCGGGHPWCCGHGLLLCVPMCKDVAQAGDGIKLLVVDERGGLV